MTRRPVCLYLLGEAPAEVAANHGDYRSHIAHLLPGQPVELTAADVRAKVAMPHPRDYAGVVLSGSPASMTEPEPWMEVAVDLVRLAAAAGTPALGICFGHQVIGAAYGAGVVENPLGWEIGTHAITLSDLGQRDPLFADMPDEIEVNLSHHDIVPGEELSPVNGVRILAHNRKSNAQAIAAGDAIRGVQCHPEFDGALTRAYIAARRDTLAADAEARDAPEDHPSRLLETARDCPFGERIFHNFITHWVLKS